MKKLIIFWVILLGIGTFGCVVFKEAPEREIEKVPVTIDKTSNIPANTSFMIQHHAFIAPSISEIAFNAIPDYDQNSGSVVYTWDDPATKYGAGGTKDTFTNCAIGVSGFMPALQLTAAQTAGWWESAWMDMAVGAVFAFNDSSRARCDTVTGWAASDDGINPDLDTTNMVEGAGCVNAGINTAGSGNTYGTYTITLAAAKDASKTDRLHMAIYLAAGTKAKLASGTAMRVELQSTAGNWSYVNVAASDLTDNQWNFVTKARSAFAVGAGTLNWASIAKIRIIIYEAATPVNIALGDIKFDEIFMWTEKFDFDQYPKILSFLQDLDNETIGYKVMFTSDFTSRKDHAGNAVTKLSSCTNITTNKTALHTLENDEDMSDISQMYRFVKVRIDISRTDTNNNPRVYSMGVSILGRKETVITSEHGEYDILTYRAEEEHKGDILEFQKPMAWSVELDNEDGRFNTDKPDSPYNLEWFGGKSQLADKTAQITVYKDAEKDYLTANPTIYRKMFFTGYVGSSPQSQANALEGIERNWEKKTVTLSGTCYIGKFVKDRSLARVPALKNHTIDEIIWLYAWYAGLPPHRFDIIKLLYDVAYISPRENDLYSELFFIFSNDIGKLSFNSTIEGNVSISKNVDNYIWALKKDLSDESLSQATIYELLHDTANDILIAGTYPNGQIWKSKDKGETWTLKKDLSNETPSQDRIWGAVSDSINNILLVSTYPDAQVWKSSDAGETWTLKKDLSNENPSQTYARALVHDSTNNVQLVGTYPNGQIWKSVDAGETWTLKKNLSNENPSQTYIVSSVYDSINDILLVGTYPNGQIWKSVDAGETWTLKKNLSNENPSQTYVTALVHDTTNDILIAGTYPNGQIWKSKDKGETWTLKKNLRNKTPGIREVSKLIYDSTNSRLMAVTTPAGLVLPAGQIWISGNAGETWELEKDLNNALPPQTYIIGAVYDSTNNLLLVGTYPDAQIWISERSKIDNSLYSFDTQALSGRQAIDINSIEDFSKKAINGVQIDAVVFGVSGDKEIIYEWIEQGDTYKLSANTIVVMTLITLDMPIDDGTEEADLTRVQLEVRKQGGTLYMINNHRTKEQPANTNPTKAANGYEIEYFHVFGNKIYLAFDVGSSDVTLDICRVKGYLVVPIERIIAQYPENLDQYDKVISTSYLNNANTANDVCRRIHEAENKGLKVFDCELLDGISTWITHGYMYLYHTVGDEDIYALRVKCLSTELSKGIWRLKLIEYQDSIPPGPPTSFSGARAGGTVTLSWTNPSDADFARVKVQYRADFYPTSINEGMEVYCGRLETVDYDAAATAYFSIWAIDSSGNVSEVAQWSG